MAFTHLHVHSEYSLLDGMSKISKAPEYVKSQGMDSLAITDHGVMFGIIDFYLDQCAQHDIRGYEQHNLQLLDVGKLNTLERLPKPKDGETSISDTGILQHLNTL